MFKDYAPSASFRRSTPKMPEGWKSPLRVDLYQVVVEPTDGSPPLFVGPAMLKDYAGMFCEAISKAIASGKERQWGNPHVVLARPAQTPIDAKAARSFVMTPSRPLHA